MEKTSSGLVGLLMNLAQCQKPRPGVHKADKGSHLSEETLGHICDPSSMSLCYEGESSLIEIYFSSNEKVILNDSYRYVSGGILHVNFEFPSKLSKAASKNDAE